jgi:AcrR family transcriptional regulator
MFGFRQIKGSRQFAACKRFIGLVDQEAAAQGVQTPARKKYESPRQLERQANILATTREMLAEVGYSATTMRGLAQRANVAPGTLYNLYKSKDALVFAAVEDLLDELAQRAIKSSAEGIERILVQAEESAASIMNGPQYAEAMSRALFTSERDDLLTKRLYARGTPMLERQIRIAIERGQLREDVDPAVLARQITASTWGIIMAWVMGTVPIEDFRTELLRAHIMILLSAASGEGKRLLTDYMGGL